MKKKVFNLSELHLSEMTCYKIHTLRILPATSSRHLSTTNQRFKQEDSNDNDKNQNDGGNDKQFENMMKFVALTTGGLIVFNVLFG